MINQSKYIIILIALILLTIFYRILILGGSGSVKINMLLNLMKIHRPDIDKIYLFSKDPLQSLIYLSTVKKK